VYLCLNFGFKGQYRHHPQGFEVLVKQRHQLYNTIRQERGEFSSALLSITTQVSTTMQPKQKNRLLKNSLIGAGILAGLAVILYGLLYVAEKPLLQKISTDSNVTVTQS